LTVIYEQGNVFWIETANFPRQVLAGTTQVNFPYTIIKGGTFLGMSVTIDGSLTVAESSLTNLTIRNGAGAEILFGDRFDTGDTILVTVSNGNAGAVTIGVHGILMMRGTGH